MKKLQVNMVILLSLFLYTGCANLETNSYKVIGSTAVTVDAAMNGWGDYVRAGLASAENEFAVKTYYQGYQTAMTAAQKAVNTYRLNKDKTAFNLALDILDASKNTLLDAITKGQNVKR